MILVIFMIELLEKNEPDVFLNYIDKKKKYNKKQTSQIHSQMSQS